MYNSRNAHNISIVQYMYISVQMKPKELTDTFMMISKTGMV